MYELFDKQALEEESFSGDAWNVYYEYGDGFEWWGHSGEFADEPDAWFKSFDDAKEFADEVYGDEFFESKLLNAPEGGATNIMLVIHQCDWEDGVPFGIGSGYEDYVEYARQDESVVIVGGTLRQTYSE